MDSKHETSLFPPVDHDGVGHPLATSEPGNQPCLKHDSSDDTIEQLQCRVTELQAQLRHEQDYSARVFRSSMDYLSFVCHELRTPLNAILGFSTLMLNDGSLSQPYSDKLNIIHTCGTNMCSMLEELLETCRIDAGRLQLDDKPFVPARALDQVIASHTELAQKHHATLHGSNHIPAVLYARGDEKRVRQVLSSVLHYVIITSQSGFIRVDARFSLNDRILSIDVHDSSSSFSHHHIKDIFQPFFRDESSHEPGRPVDLGLYVSRRLVEIMNGSLTVRQDAPNECLFSISLPLGVDVMPADHGSMVDFAGMRALVAVGDVACSDMIANYLRMSGFDVKVVFSSIEGVDSAFDITPGLIVVSSQLSDLGGVEMLKSIYDGGAYEGLKIIGITSSTMNHDDLVTFENYCDRVCSLPLLVTDVHSHLLALYDNDTLDKPGSAIAADTLVVHQFPPHPTLEELKMLALCGNYVEISKIICTLERENIGYSGFCSEMRKRIKKYDSDGIAMFLATAVPC